MATFETPAITIRNSEDLLALKAQQFTGPIADGDLSTGKHFEIILSRKSAVKEGLHLIIAFPGVADLNPLERAECFAVMNEFACRHPLAQQFGYRFDQNFGEMQTRPEAHAHAIIPGSTVEAKSAPRIVDPWQGAALPRT